MVAGLPGHDVTRIVLRFSEIIPISRIGESGVESCDMALGRDNINGPIAPLETRIELDQDFVRLLNWCREV